MLIDCAKSAQRVCEKGVQRMCKEFAKMCYGHIKSVQRVCKESEKCVQRVCKGCAKSVQKSGQWKAGCLKAGKDETFPRP